MERSQSVRWGHNFRAGVRAERGVDTRSPHELALEKAMERIARERIKESDFVDLYGLPNVTRDQAYVQKVKKTYTAERPFEIALILEAIIDELIFQGEWLGEDATPIKTSEYDDIVNGVDTLIEYSRDARFDFLALGMDVTFANDVSQKLFRIKKEIEDGRLATVKYYQSDQGNYRGELKNIPRIIFRVPIQQVEELRNLWISDKKEDKIALRDCRQIA